MNNTMGKSSARKISIQETTVATIDGWKVTVGNIIIDDWTGPDGSPRRGLTAEIGLYDERKAERGRLTLGEGGLLEIKGRPWRVTLVSAGAGGENGAVKLTESLP
nr:hypothetical protein [Candidatus Sigynarchaeota archaeon]